MKIKAIKEVIPKHTVEKEVYVCETCGTEHEKYIDDIKSRKSWKQKIGEYKQ